MQQENEEQSKKHASDFEGGTHLSATYRISVGCGNLYVTIIYDEDGRFRRIFIPRNSKFHCDLIIRDALSRLASFQGKRNLDQLIKDLRGDKYGHHCEKYNVNAEAASCFDAVSKALEKWKNEKPKRKETKVNA